MTYACMQEESTAVVTSQRIKSTAQEVVASRHKYQAKSMAAEQLRKHRVHSSESETLELVKARQVCSVVSVLPSESANTQLFIKHSRVHCS